MEDITLKSPQVVRLFMSSPFNGMEKERDILTKFYWPKIESALSAKGLHLKLVDMRWGITNSSSSASQTINICLKEIDRSDVFIGLFGQRYGWNGRNDSGLQDNFNKAEERFPWVDQYRDRSVTEVEYLHGHLNNPGNMPACFCFRDKSYDDKVRKEAELKGDAKRQYSFKAEDENSFKKLEDLKALVHSTESKTLGVSMNYRDPQEAAEFIYKKVWKYVENEIIAKIQKPITEKEKVTMAHKAYQASQCGLHVGGKKYVDELDRYISNTDTDQCPLTISGPTGCGKTSLLSNWLQEKTKANVKDDKQMFFFHFVGAEPDSVHPRYIMTRLIDYIMFTLTGDEFDYKDEKKKLSLPKLTEKMVETLALLSKFKDKQLIVVIDNVDKVSRSKTSMPFFWLPKDIPSNVRVIISLTEGASDAEELWEVLTEVHETKRMTIEPLTEAEKNEMCSQLLEENSKSMDYEQLLMITNSERTKNPFFLKILINELCVAGLFRQLSQQIKNLLESDGILGLLVKVLGRIQEDYTNTEYDGDVVQEVLCALCLCKDGISESEFPMPQLVWAPVIYALKPFLTDRGSLLGFAFTELNQAVQIIYMATLERKRSIAKKVSDIFFREYEKCSKEGKKINARTASELLHLLRLSDDRTLIRKVLGDIRIFESIGAAGNFKLNEYWQWLGTPSLIIANQYLRSLDALVAEEYGAYLDHCEMDTWHTVLKRKSGLIQHLYRWFEESKLYQGFEKLLNRALELDGNRPGISIMKRKEYICVIKYQTACHLADIEKHCDALQLHNEVLELRQELIKANAMDKEDMGTSYNVIGLCHYALKDYDEAQRWYEMALEVRGKTQEGQIQMSYAHCNLGSIWLERENYDKALEEFEKSVALREEVEPNVLSLEAAHDYNNIGIVYNMKNEYDLAEKFFLKTLKIKEALLGRNSIDVALSILNIGNLECARKNYEKALECSMEALKIFQSIAPAGSFMILQTKENTALQYERLGRYEEAEPLFLEVIADLKKMPGGLSNGLPHLHRKFVKWYIDNDRYEEAAEIALELIKCDSCKALDYAYFGFADDSLPPHKKKDRTESTTLSYGLKKYPLDENILRVKLGILNRRSPKQLVPFVCTYCEDEDLPGSTEDRYVQAVDILKDSAKDLEKAIAVLEEATKEKPERSKLLEKLKTFQSLRKDEGKTRDT